MDLENYLHVLPAVRHECSTQYEEVHETISYFTTELAGMVT